MPEKVTVTIDVEVPDDWVELCARYSDLFSSDYCGYWMRGITQRNTCGWLVWEYESDPRLNDFLAEQGVAFLDHVPSFQEKRFHSEAVTAWKEGRELPPYYHRLDKAAAVKAYAAMVSRPGKMGGVDWYERGDASAYDIAIQLALLGKVVYG